MAKEIVLTCDLHEGFTVATETYYIRNGTGETRRLDTCGEHGEPFRALIRGDIDAPSKEAPPSWSRFEYDQMPEAIQKVAFYKTKQGKPRRTPGFPSVLKTLRAMNTAWQKGPVIWKKAKITIGVFRCNTPKLRELKCIETRGVKFNMEYRILPFGTEVVKQAAKLGL